MSVLEVEVLKGLTDEKITELSQTLSQLDFHRQLYGNIKTPFRRKVLGILTEIYLAFVLGHSLSLDKIDTVFMNLLNSIKYPLDLVMLRAGYSVYSEVLASELAKIRKYNKEQ